MSLAKTVIRIGLIGGLAAGGLALIAGPQRVHALFHQARHTVTNAIDNAIDDPVALRNQLRNLEKQYPERIASVRGELASLDQQVAELTRDRDVANKVVELASADFSVLEASLAQAESARTESPSAIIRVRFDQYSSNAIGDAIEAHARTLSKIPEILENTKIISEKLRHDWMAQDKAYQDTEKAKKVAPAAAKVTATAKEAVPAP